MKFSSPFWKNKYFQGAIAVLVWVALWWLAAGIIGEKMILPAPAGVAATLFTMAKGAGFWKSILFSMSRVMAGFFTGLLAGIAFAAVAYRLKAVDIFLRPMISAIKAAPVASYIILFLLLMPSSRLSGVISFTMAFPLVYTNVLEGLGATDKKLLEMAQIYGVSRGKKTVYIYFSTVMPFLISACSLALGMCWKAGIAAEVIGMPTGSIGEGFYHAKIFVDTTTAMAWTVTVIIISLIIEKLSIFLLKKLMKAVERA